MRWGGKLDLAAGIALGIALGLVLAYLVVFVIGSGNSGSDVTDGATTAPRESTTKAGPSERGAPQRP
jgi:hypothetical protein